MRFCTRGRRAGFNFFVGYVVLLCLAVVAVVAVDGGGVCAPTPQKFF